MNASFSYKVKLFKFFKRLFTKKSTSRVVSADEMEIRKSKKKWARLKGEDDLVLEAVLNAALNSEAPVLFVWDSAKGLTKRG